MHLLDNIKAFAQRQSLKGRQKDPATTGICPLEEIKSVAVFFDADLSGSVLTISRIQELFSKQGIKAQVFPITLGAQIISEGMQKATFVHKDDINWFGKIKTGKKHPLIDVDEDLFISLFQEDSFAVEYAARCSKARFKIGRKQLDGDIYDLVINEPEDRQFNQLQAFESIMNFLLKIKY